MRVFILLPGREATGIAKGFRRKQSEGERNRNASARFELERDVRQLFAIGGSEAIAADVDSAENLADVRSFVRDRGKQRQRRQRVSGQFRDRDVLIRNLLLRREMPLDGCKFHIVDEDLATVDFQLQRLVLAAANHLTELLELHEDCREIIFQVGKQPKLDLLDYVAGSEVKHVRFSFDFDPLIRLDERRPGDQLPQCRKSTGQ